MSNNPYDQARDDARSGRGLTPGADEGVYWAERRAREENQKAKEDLERRGTESSAWPGHSAEPAPSIPSAPMSPEQARAGLLGLFTLPVAIAIAPIFVVLYPAAALTGALVGYGAWQVSQKVSPGSGAFTGLFVGGLALLAAGIGVRLEPALARLPGYSVVRFPMRLVLFGVLALVPLMLATGGAQGCVSGTEPESFGEFLTMLRAFYECTLGRPSNLAILAVGMVLFAFALRSARLREIWHRFLGTLGLRAVT